MEAAIQANCLGRLYAAEVFGAIYQSNAWCGKHSVSGPGSDVERCSGIVAGVSKLIKDLGIASILDVPCGDFAWMSQADLSGVEYHGVDVVSDLIRKNIRENSSSRVRFSVMNMSYDELPCCDLVLCRDGLVHFSIADALAAVERIKQSGAEYLLCTTFTSADRKNDDIETGHWRPLNMQNYPFNFPYPMATIRESNEGKFSDKSLGLWRIKDLK